MDIKTLKNWKLYSEITRCAPAEVKTPNPSDKLLTDVTPSELFLNDTSAILFIPINTSINDISI